MTERRTDSHPYVPSRRVARVVVAAAIAAALAKPLVAQEDAPRTVRSESPRGPDVTLIESEERRVFEYRQNGLLRMVKVVPKLGKPYYLVPADPTRGFGDIEQAETLVARWNLVEF